MNIHRQPTIWISQGINTRDNAAPTRPPEWNIPLAMPRSFIGIQLYTARVEPGNAPASPAPKKKREMIIDAEFHAIPVNTVKTLQKATTNVNRLLGPYVSANQPEGIWNNE